MEEKKTGRFERSLTPPSSSNTVRLSPLSFACSVSLLLLGLSLTCSEHPRVREGIVLNFSFSFCYSVVISFFSGYQEPVKVLLFFSFCYSIIIILVVRFISDIFFFLFCYLTIAVMLFCIFLVFPSKGRYWYFFSPFSP